MKTSIGGLTPANQAQALFLLGICITLLIFYGLTNHFNGITVPDEYGILIGK